MARAPAIYAVICSQVSGSTSRPCNGARAGLDVAAYTTAWTGGQGLTWEEAVAEAQTMLAAAPAGVHAGNGDDRAD